LLRLGFDELNWGLVCRTNPRIAASASSAGAKQSHWMNHDVSAPVPVQPVQAARAASAVRDDRTGLALLRIERPRSGDMMRWRRELPSVMCVGCDALTRVDVCRWSGTCPG
jgi:hypothetical protein